VTRDEQDDLVVGLESPPGAQLRQRRHGRGGGRLREHPGLRRQEALARQDLAVGHRERKAAARLHRLFRQMRVGGTETEIESAMVVGWRAFRYRPVAM